MPLFKKKSTKKSLQETEQNAAGDLKFIGNQRVYGETVLVEEPARIPTPEPIKKSFVERNEEGYFIRKGVSPEDTQKIDDIWLARYSQRKLPTSTRDTTAPIPQQDEPGLDAIEQDPRPLTTSTGFHSQRPNTQPSMTKDPSLPHETPDPILIPEQPVDTTSPPVQEEGYAIRYKSNSLPDLDMLAIDLMGSTQLNRKLTTAPAQMRIYEPEPFPELSSPEKKTTPAAPKKKKAVKKPLYSVKKPPVKPVKPKYVAPKPKVAPKSKPIVPKSILKKPVTTVRVTDPPLPSTKPKRNKDGTLIKDVSKSAPVLAKPKKPTPKPEPKVVPINPESTPNILRATFHGARSTEDEINAIYSTDSSPSDSINTLGSQQDQDKQPEYATDLVKEADIDPVSNHERAQSAKTYHEFYGLSRSGNILTEEPEMDPKQRKAVEKENLELKKQVSSLKRGLLQDLSQTQYISNTMFSKIPTSVQTNLNLRYQFKKRMDLERDQYIQLQEENKALALKVKALQARLLKRVLNEEKSGSQANEAKFWRTKFQEMMQEKNELKEKLNETFKKYEKESKHKEILRKRLHHVNTQNAAIPDILADLTIDRKVLDMTDRIKKQKIRIQPTPSDPELYGSLSALDAQIRPGRNVRSADTARGPFISKPIPKRSLKDTKKTSKSLPGPSLKSKSVKSLAAKSTKSVKSEVDSKRSSKALKSSHQELPTKPTTALSVSNDALKEALASSNMELTDKAILSSFVDSSQPMLNQSDSVKASKTSLTKSQRSLQEKSSLKKQSNASLNKSTRLSSRINKSTKSLSPTQSKFNSNSSLNKSKKVEKMISSAKQSQTLLPDTSQLIKSQSNLDMALGSVLNSKLSLAKQESEPLATTQESPRVGIAKKPVQRINGLPITEKEAERMRLAKVQVEYDVYVRNNGLSN